MNFSQAEVVSYLEKNMPSIGFLNNTKRIQCYWIIALYIEELVSTEKISDDDARELMIQLNNKNTTFQKAALAALLQLPKMSAGDIPNIPNGKHIGYEFLLVLKHINNL